MKKKGNRNPVYMNGYKAGFEHGKTALVELVSGHLNELKNEPGIGPKTWQKIEGCLIRLAKEQGGESE